MVNQKLSTLVTTNEAAKILGISRVAVFKRIKAGKLRATKVGGRYLLDSNQLGVFHKKLTAEDKREIQLVVARVIKEYGDVLRKLGSE